jgi:G3E family GTPase
MASFSAAIPVTLLTGFLGSGKTTLLNTLLKTPQFSNSAVLVNEFGDIGIDHTLVRQVADNVVILPDGCICCSIRGELITALHTLHLERVRGSIPSFDRLVIETTGLADPTGVPITLLKDSMAGAVYRMDGIITTADALFVAQSVKTTPETAKQIAMADVIVLTKQDQATPQQREVAEATLRTLAPETPILRPHYNATNQTHDIDPTQLVQRSLIQTDGSVRDTNAWLGHHQHAHPPHAHAHAHEHEHEHAHEHSHVYSLSIALPDRLPMATILQRVETTCATLGIHLLRLKGIVHPSDFPHPFALHALRHLCYPPAPLPQQIETKQQHIVAIMDKDMRSTFQRIMCGKAATHS